VQIHPQWWPGRSKHLLFLGSQLAGLERRGFFHCRERQQLQQVVLYNVAGDADAVEIAGSAADPDVLRHRDLDMIDVVVVPHRSNSWLANRSAIMFCTVSLPR
jgi:hypothetical protein